MTGYNRASIIANVPDVASKPLTSALLLPGISATDLSACGGRFSCGVRGVLNTCQANAVFSLQKG